MADQESGSAEAEQNANSELAQQNDQPNSESASQVDDSTSDLAKRFDETANELKAEIAKAKKEAQSTKDKQFANQSKEINQLKESVVALAEMFKAGVPSQSVSRGNEEQDGTTQHVKDIFALSLGVEASAVENTPQYIDFVNGGGLKLQGMEKIANASKFAIANIKPKTEVSQAARAQPPGGGATEPSSQDLVNQYTTEMAANRGNKTALRATKAKFKSQGVDVDNIGFSV